MLTGGRARTELGELFYEPTVLTGVTPEMACYAEETFGPVVSLYAVADDDEAVARANDSEYGLNGSVWTGDPERGRAGRGPDAVRHGERQRGVRGDLRQPRRPDGRDEELGLGRRQGQDGIRRFVEVQSVGTQTGMPIAPSRGLDPQTFTNVMTSVMRVLKTSVGPEAGPSHSAAPSRSDAPTERRLEHPRRLEPNEWRNYVHVGCGTPAPTR